MLLAILALIIGLGILVYSADAFIEGAQAIALHLGMSPILVGIIIIGFGTSAPEMMISAIAAVDGSPGIAIGNAFGSNVANIGLILGVTALLTPIVANGGILKKEFPILIAVTLGIFAIMFDGQLSRIDGLILIACLVALLTWFAKTAQSAPAAALENVIDEVPATPTMSLGKACGWTLIQLILLMSSSKLFVWGATAIAVSLGVSDVVIGLTIVALGTSLPELASSIAAVRKNEHDMAIGNIVGSNLFNTLAVIGIAASIKPLDYPLDLLIRDWSVLAAFTFGLFFMAFQSNFKKDPQASNLMARPLKLTRVHGFILLAGYCSYMVCLGWSSFV